MLYSVKSSFAYGTDEFRSHEVFVFFHYDSNWMNCPLAQGLSIVYHLGRVILRVGFCHKVPSVLCSHFGVFS